MPQNHYELLGVTRTSSATEIRSAYRKLVLKHHPDHSSDPRSSEMLRGIVEAYEVLSDKERRKNYDAGLVLEEARRKAQARDAAKQRQPTPQPRPQPRPKPTATPDPKPKTSDIDRLGRLFGKGRFEEAEQLAHTILSRNRREAIPYVVLGDIARARGDRNEAINMYARAVQADPRNPVYERRYEELVNAAASGELAGQPASATQWSALFLGIAVCICCCAYITLSKENPMFPGLSLISSWTPGLVVMLFISGVSAGVSLCVGGLLDRFSSVSTTSLGKISPAMALGTVAIVNFWAATLLYVLLGLSQKAFNFSTTRLVGAIAGIVCIAAVSAEWSWNGTRAGLDWVQVLVWGGNLAYIGAICGWLVSDSFKRA